MSGAAKSWVEFWDSPHSIYVNDRHKLLHARAVAADIARHIPSPEAVVLDYGCGEALYAEDVARRCGRLVLCEAAEGLRRALAERVRGLPNVEVQDPAAVARLPEGSLDLVIANSLVQYLTREELASLLRLWRAKLKRGGTLVVADVIPPDASPVSDAAALLRFAWNGGFLLAAIAGLARTALSEYRVVRARLGLATYGEAEFQGMLADAGFEARRTRPNFGHNQGRMSFRARPV